MIVTYDDMIMSKANRVCNRVKALRQARGISQAELAAAAGLSRTGVSAIEAARLIPSVAAALRLAEALGCTVEELFTVDGPAPRAEFAWLPSRFPCRYWVAEVGGRNLLFPVDGLAHSELAHDGVARHDQDFPSTRDVARRTLVLASCDPAAPLLARAYERRGDGRILLLSRTSSEALRLLQAGLVHVAGVHFATRDAAKGNALEVQQRIGNQNEFDLLHVAEWEAGLASQPAVRLRSLKAATRDNVRWVGRAEGAAARKHQDAVLGARRPPRHIATDHRGVAEAIRAQWADVGVCLRLVSDEAGLSFLPLCEECYDLCYLRQSTNDPRVVALVQTVRHGEYRQLLAELPGYRPQPQWGEVEHVAEPSR